MKILFVCVENACRSQMAEGIFNHLVEDKHKAFSAGSSLSKGIDPLAVKVMAEILIDISGQKPKLVSAEMVKDADKVISMGCINGCSIIKIDEDWKVEDPKGKGIEKFREVRDIIYQKVSDLIRKL